MISNVVNADLPGKQHLAKRVGKKPVLMHYNRLIVLVILINLCFFAVNIFAVNTVDGGWRIANNIDLITISNLMLTNFSIAILVRQQYVINLFFWLATRAPTSWPLSIRWTLGKVYHFGGLHVGCAVAATLWFAVFVAALGYHLINNLPGVSVEIVCINATLMMVLLAMILLALPPIRSRFHNGFERMHRFGGWSALALFWTQTLLFINEQRGDIAFPSALVTSISFWMLIVLTLSIALPWLRLKKVPVEIVKPSSHVALVKFNYGVKPFAGSSTALSRNPLLEWHSFANVPAPSEPGFRLTISRAGDWTGSFIDDAPSHIWVKGIPTAGVANIEVLFKRVIYVATGSGIGPCLPHLLAKEVPSRLVWSTRNPRKTYGDDLLNEILAVQPDALIWNTDKSGKPDLITLAYNAYKAFDAEAIICISNKKLTWQVVYGMESRGIPAYGAIWDS